LTPSKVLMTETGQLKLVDFRAERLHDARRVAATSNPLEAAAYLAPEQIRGRPSVPRKADLYALGCMLFEMLVGRPPFAAESVELLLEKHRSEEAPRVASLVFDCPMWLDSLVSQLLEKDPASRPIDALAVAAALTEIKEKMAAGAGVAGVAATGQPSALARPDDRAALQAAVGRKKKKKQRPTAF